MVHIKESLKIGLKCKFASYYQDSPNSFIVGLGLWQTHSRRTNILPKYNCVRVVSAS